MGKLNYSLLIKLMLQFFINIFFLFICVKPLAMLTKSRKKSFVQL